MTKCQGAVTSQGQRSLWWKKKSGLLRSKRDYELLDLRGKKKDFDFFNLGLFELVYACDFPPSIFHLSHLCLIIFFCSTSLQYEWHICQRVLDV